MLSDFHSLPEFSRIWMYASEETLTSKQQDFILDYISDHLLTWNAHKADLTAGVTILENHFIVVALDESKNKASGCSIDTLQQTIQKLEMELSLSLLNRLNVYCKIDGEIHCIPCLNLKGNVDSHTLFYDLTVQKKEDLNTYLKPIKDGWCNRFIV